MPDTSGWISLHRQVQNHWIWRDPVKFQWWIDILLTVNNEDAKVNLGYNIFDCKRGESLLSLQGWASRWKVSKDTARNFLKLLERDNMIKCVSVGKSTRLSVCKYDDYQNVLHVNQTHSERNTYTNNKVSKDTIKKRRDDFKNQLAPFLNVYGKDMLNSFYKHWIELNKSKTKMKFEMEKTWELSLRLDYWKRRGDGISFKKKNNYQTQPDYNQELN